MAPLGPAEEQAPDWLLHAMRLAVTCHRGSKWRPQPHTSGRGGQKHLSPQTQPKRSTVLVPAGAVMGTRGHSPHTVTMTLEALARDHKKV